MGVFDTVVVIGASGHVQIKGWENAPRTYRVGDKVPALDGLVDYLVALLEGGYLIAVNGTLVGWTDARTGFLEDLPVFDKWGEPLTAGSRGLLGEPHGFREEEKAG